MPFSTLDLLLTLPFAVAALIAFQPGRRRSVGWLAGGGALLGLVLLAGMAPRVFAGEVLQSRHAWLPSLGLDFLLRVDGLAWMFALLVLLIGALVVLYAVYYLDAKDSPVRFFGYLSLFMGSMLGVVLAGNVLLLVVFWELTSISSFLLIGFWSHRADARRGARMALLVTGMGGLALLGGAILLGRIVGSYDLDIVLQSGDAIRAHRWYPAMLLLVLLGVFTKSAQFPFHFWLPQAMAAPTPVSAYLHSATMVKAGVFLLARLHPVLAGTDLFFYTVCAIGAATLLIGAWNAIFQHDIKGLLAYSTISHLGLITLLFGLSRPLAVVAALFHILNHATFKASLFMAAGIIDHEAGTRDMRRLGGLRKALPFTATLAIIASMAMAGVPLLNGFLSKEMFLAETLAVDGRQAQLAIAGAALLASVFAVAYSLRFVHDTFFGRMPDALRQRDIHEPVRWMKIPVEILVVACLLVGMAPAWTIAPVLDAGVRGTLGAAAPDYSLALWHGINAPLLMSIAGMLGGIALYFGLRRLLDIHVVIVRSPFGRLFTANVEALFVLAQRFTAWVAGGGLRRSLFWLLIVCLVVGALPFAGRLDAAAALAAATQPMPWAGWMIWLVLVFTALAAVALRAQRFTALVILGATGTMVSLVFALLSAPDLALTQILVEMVTLTLLMMALNYLPERAREPSRLARRMRDAAIAVAAGLALAMAAFAIMTRPQHTIAGELLARSLPEGHGRNVVNVILVDFRGFDTFGEIMVFAVAGLVVHALLKWARLTPDVAAEGPPARFPMPADITQLLFPVTLAVSLFLFLRGHNAPGGGFIAGLAIAVPVLIKYVLEGARAVEASFGFDYLRGMAIGMLVAVAGGLGSLLFGLPFLTSGYTTLDLPGIASLSLASAMVFDAGVYMVVFCSTLLMLSTTGTVHHRAQAGDAVARESA